VVYCPADIGNLGIAKKLASQCTVDPALPDDTGTLPLAVGQLNSIVKIDDFTIGGSSSNIFPHLVNQRGDTEILLPERKCHCIIIKLLTDIWADHD